MAMLSEIFCDQQNSSAQRCSLDGVEPVVQEDGMTPLASAENGRPF